MNDLFKTKDAAGYLATDEAKLRLIQSDPRYLEPTLSSLHFMCFRLLFDHGMTLEATPHRFLESTKRIKESNASCLVRHVTIERGPFGSFDLENGISVIDKVIKSSLLESIEREYAGQDLPAIREGSSICSNTNYVEVQWMFNRTSRQAGWALPNRSMEKLHAKLRRLVDSLLAIKTS